MIYDIDFEVRNELWYKLLDISLFFCDKFLFVIHDDFKKSENLNLILKELDHFLIISEIKSNWPGTEILFKQVQVNTYIFNEITKVIIIKYSNSLFDWQQPDLPEDLCLINRNNKPWLINIAHEDDAYMDINEDEKEKLHYLIPELILRKIEEK